MIALLVGSNVFSPGVGSTVSTVGWGVSAAGDGVINNGVGTPLSFGVGGNTQAFLNRVASSVRNLPPSNMEMLSRKIS